MNIHEVRERAEDPTNTTHIVKLLKKLKAHNASEALSLLKSIFFSPHTHPEVRYTLANMVGEFNNQQFFQQILSYFILKSFPDTLSLIRALKSCAHSDAVPTLQQYFIEEANQQERLEIINALASIQAPETIEFLSQIHNNRVTYTESLSPQELVTIREEAGSALSKQIMRFD